MGLGSGGHNVFGQAKGVPESEIHRLVHRALDLGINLFDTSPDYRDSELILGRALKGIPRDRYILSSKVALVKSRDPDRLATPQQVIQSVESSLTRLQVDELDVLFMAGFVSLYDQIVADLMPTLQKLCADGKFRYLGASEKSSDDGAHHWLVRVLQANLVDVVMVAYNMINQSAEKTVFPLCRQNDVGVLAIYTVRNVFSRPERLSEVIRDLKRRGILTANVLPDNNPLDWLRENQDDSLVSPAYRFVANNDAVTTVMTGTINPQHLEENVGSVLLRAELIGGARLE
jgi:aryl-alcohol dehydrogenase-like predicted oxidoreductase